MGEIVIVDTSILLNVLNVPGLNQDREVVFKQFAECIDRHATLLVPLGAVLEVGNHIARISDGNKRWHHAKIFRDQMGKALKGEAPWALIPLPDHKQLVSWLNDFPNSAMQGAGLVDLSIIKAWEATRERHHMSRVRIWSLDSHLQGYDEPGVG